MLILLIGSALSATVGSLAQQARHGSLTARGEAIIALSAQRSPAADAALRELHEDEGQDMLVRTWAAAARIQQATSLDELLALSELLQTFPALARPIRLQLDRLPAGTFSVTAGLSLMQDPALAEAIAPAVMARPLDELVAALLTHPDTAARRTVAGLLATRGQSDPAVADAVVAALIWSDRPVPWAGGALFLPALTWSQPDAGQLAESLIAWHLYCDRHGLSDEQRQITSNLRSVALLEAAGLSRRGATTTRQWLTLLGTAHGQAAVDRVLVPQGMESRYAVTLP